MTGTDLSMLEQARFQTSAKRSPSGCLEWQGSSYSDGRARYRTGTGSSRPAAKVAFEIANGPVPSGFIVTQSCGNLRCVDISHLSCSTGGAGLSLKQRLLSHVVRRSTTGCWIWGGSLAQGGYGQLTVDHKRVAAHRVSYEAFVGPIPAGLHIDHLCSVRKCINPEHLEAVTQAENNRRAVARNRVAS